MATVTIAEYLEGCRKDPLMYAGPHECLLAAIGEPEMIDTSRDSRLGRIHSNRTIRVYPQFSEFYGMEETIERIVAFFRQGAQGLEERKQILYLLGPVGGGKPARLSADHVAPGGLGCADGLPRPPLRRQLASRCRADRPIL